MIPGRRRLTNPSSVKIIAVKIWLIIFYYSSQVSCICLGREMREITEHLPFVEADVSNVGTIVVGDHFDGTRLAQLQHN